MPFLRQSTIQTVRFGPFLDATDGRTVEPALTIAQADMQLSKDGAAFASKNAAGNATHDTDGWYSTSFNATDSATVGELILQVDVAGALPVWFRWWVIEEAIYDAIYGAAATGFNASGQIVAASVVGHTPQTGDSFPRLGAPAGASIAADLLVIDDFVDELESRLTAARAANLDEVTAVRMATLTDWINGGRLDLLLDAVNTVTPATEAQLNARTIVAANYALEATVAALNNLSTTDLDARLAAINLDHIVGTATGIPAVVAGTYLDQMTRQAAGTFDRETDSLQAIRDTAPMGSAMVGTTGASTHSAADVWAVVTRVLTANTNLNDPTAAAIMAAILDELTANARTAGSFGQLLKDNLDAPVSGANTATPLTAAQVNAEADTAISDASLATALALATVQSDTDNIQTRLPVALVGGRMDSDVGVVQASAAQTIRDEIMPTQNAAFSNIEFLFVAASDHVTPVTAASGTAATRSIDGGAFAAGTGTIAEVGNGIYQYDASAADMNGGVITLRFTGTGGTPGAPDDVFLTIVTGGGV